MADLLKAIPAVKGMTADLKSRSEALLSRGVQPTLGILRVGEREDDLSYEKGAVKRCEQAGIAVRKTVLPEDASQQSVLAEIDRLNRDREIHGVLIFRPLPPQIDDAAVCRALAPEKDVDGITAQSMAGIFSGTHVGFPPCTPQGCIELLRHYDIPLKGKRAVVLGRSLVVGKPLSMLLLEQNATVTICHSRTENLAEVCRGADILIAAVGKQEMVTADFVSPGQAVIDVGIHVREDGSLCGDVDFEAVKDIVGSISPVPGGAGTMTAAVLAKHVIEAAERTVSKES